MSIPTINLQCRPPLDPEILALAVDSMLDARGKFITDIAAKWFTETLMEGKLLCATSGTSDNGVFFLWRETHWEPIHDKCVLHDINHLFHQPRRANEIIELIRQLVRINRTQLDRNDRDLYLK